MSGGKVPHFSVLSRELHAFSLMQKSFNDRHVDIGFSRKLNVFVWSCVKRLGASGFKFPAKGSLPVILSSIGFTNFQGKSGKVNVPVIFR